MLRKCFSLASAVGLGGIVVWAGCSSSDPAPDGATTQDGGQSSGDGGGQSSGSTTDGSTTTPNTDGSTTDGSSGGPPLNGVDIKFGECPAFTKCGGDVKGNYTVTGGCLSNAAFNAVREQPGCEALQEKDLVIKAEGTVKVTDTQVERNTVVNLRGKLDVPKSCNNIGNCRFVEAALKSNILGIKFDEATCTDNGTVCNCNAAAKLTETSTDNYEVDEQEGVLTTTQGQQTRTFEYCVNGNKNSYKETTGGEKAIDLVIEMTK